jgi:hypothetical protein
MIPFDRLQQIIPADQALANKALSVALAQINGLSTLNLPTFARAVSAQETTKDLPLLTALTTAVPPSVANYYSSVLAEGTGVNGTVRLVDIIGLAGGWIATPNFIETVSLYGTMDLTALTTIYQQMVSAMTGVFGPVDSGPLVIPTGPAAGTYLGVEVPPTPPVPDPPPPPVYNPTAEDLARSALRSAALAEIAALQSSYPEQTTELNALWDQMAEQVVREKYFQDLIGVDFDDLNIDNRVSIYGFIYSLPGYGPDTSEGGVAWLLETMAQIPGLGGEAVIGCLREGRNEVALGNSGIYTNTRVPGEANPPEPQAELLPAVYSEDEAINLVVK